VPPDGPNAQGVQAAVTARARVVAFARSEVFTKIWRYGTVSVVSTVLTLACLYLFYRVVRVGSAGLANVIATAIATVPSYYLNRTWAWGKTGRSHLWREVIPFWVIAALGLVLSTLAVEAASREAHQLSRAREVQTILVESANLLTYAVMWVGKFLLFNGLLFKKEPALALEAGTSRRAPTGSCDAKPG
jgi:putative flippase GtrA